MVFHKARLLLYSRHIYRIRILYRAGFILVFPLPGWFGLSGRGLVQKMGRNRSRWLWEWFKRWAEMVQDGSGNFQKMGRFSGSRRVQEVQDATRGPKTPPRRPKTRLTHLQVTILMDFGSKTGAKMTPKSHPEGMSC